LFNPPDWYPDWHPAMPDIVAHGHAPNVRCLILFSKSPIINQLRERALAPC
jgi:hypothetical protein